MKLRCIRVYRTNGYAVSMGSRSKTIAFWHRSFVKPLKNLILTAKGAKR